jgi:hypothetical protein
VAPEWIAAVMRPVYPASLGVLEGVTQVTMKGQMAMFQSCLDASWPSVCSESVTLWLFVAVFLSVGVMTVRCPGLTLTPTLIPPRTHPVGFTVRCPLLTQCTSSHCVACPG